LPTDVPNAVPIRLPLDLRIYRVLAWITGVLLVILVFVGLPLKYLADVPAVDAIVGVAHGVFFFPAYVVSTLVVGYRRGWSIIKILVVAACGVIPFGSFVAEHRIVQEEALRAAPLGVQP
jgi:integral membrane protein